MTAIFYFVTYILAGWLAGKSFAILMKARETGGFTMLHWGIFIASMLGAMLFAKFVIGGARRMSALPDIVVGLSEIAMLAVFLWSSGILFRGRGR